MKQPLFMAVALFCALVFVSGEANAKRNECKNGEEMVFSIPQGKPEWIDKPHSRQGGEEMFVGLSTQNNKLEDGITLAVENANGSIVEALGQVIKKQSQGVLTFEEDDVKQSFGSAGAASYLQHKERRAIYYEKWASYDRCKPSYHYNVWVQVVVPAGEFKAETLRAEKYLRELQRSEELKAKADLMPTPEAMRVKGGAYAYKPALAQPITPPAETYQPYNFKCGSVALYGGYSYMPSVQSEMGKQEKGVFNFSGDFEFGMTRNLCMGVGMGYSMTKLEDGSNGHIVPMFLRFSYKWPFDRRGRVIGWIGVEIGGALLNNFKRNEITPDKQKDTGAFLVGPAGGLDFRLQGPVYLTVGASYTPIFYKERINLLETRIGFRYYF